MSAYCDNKGYKGFSNWLYIQYREEMAHGIHMYQHILERGALPDFADIKVPALNYSSFLDLFSKVLAHEQWVSEGIDKIASLALQEKDHATYAFIQWYVNEQIEEESNAGGIVQKLWDLLPAVYFYQDGFCFHQTW